MHGLVVKHEEVPDRTPDERIGTALVVRERAHGDARFHGLDVHPNVSPPETEIRHDRDECHTVGGPCHRS